MRKLIVIFTIGAFISGNILTGCSSSTDKVNDANDNVTEAQQNLKEAKQDAQLDAQKTASADEWKTFKTESELKISTNEIRIEQLKIKDKKTGKIFDNLYAKKIELLEKKNIDLRNRINGYEKKQSDWESFKREFNHDIDELGTAIKDLTVDNKK